MKHTSASVPSVPQTDEDSSDDSRTVTLSETLSLWLELIDPASAAYALADCLPPGLAEAVADSHVPPTPTPLFRAHFENARVLWRLGCLIETNRKDREGRIEFRATDAGAIVAAAIDSGQVRPPRFPSRFGPDEFEARLMALFAGAALERVRLDTEKQRGMDTVLHLMEQRATLTRAATLVNAPGRGW